MERLRVKSHRSQKMEVKKEREVGGGYPGGWAVGRGLSQDKGIIVL